MTAPHPTTLLIRAARYVITRGECTATRLRQDLRITERAAAAVTADLEAWGIVGPSRNGGSRIVRYSPKHLPTVTEYVLQHGTVPPEVNPLVDLASPPLIKRQRDVLNLAAEGLTNREIGQRLYLSEDTVKTHTLAAFRVLRAQDRAHAVALGHVHDLLPTTTEHRAPIQALTQDQQRLIELIAQGHSGAVIANRMSTTEAVVKNRVRGVRNAFGAINKAHLVHLAICHGVLVANPEHEVGAE